MTVFSILSVGFVLGWIVRTMVVRANKWKRCPSCYKYLECVDCSCCTECASKCLLCDNSEEKGVV